MLGPRDTRLSWPDHHMLHALIAAQRSPDPSTQVGAYIVDANNRPVASGYNSTPRGLNPNSIPWDRDGDMLNTKYAYVVHAETNAIFNAPSKDLGGCVLYSTLFPCNDCAKNIVQAGIKTVVYLDNKYSHLPMTTIAAMILDEDGVATKQHNWIDKEFVSTLLKNLVP